MNRLIVKSIVLIGIIAMSACKEKIIEPFNTGMENKPLPVFSVLRPDSSTYFSSKSLSPDKNLILFYFSPTCPYCRAQMRDMVNNINKFKNTEICVITTGEFKGMKEYCDYFQTYKYPKLITGLDTGFVIARNYAIPGVPFTAIFDKNKKMTSAYLGKVPSGNLLKLTQN